jgi:predicted N-acetyltransferase YhbS
MQIERLTANDFEEAVDFINMVFSMNRRPMDFMKYLPRIYKPTDEAMSRNLVVRDNGRIRALVGVYPDVLQVGDTALRLGGVGAVSSHPNDRGKGWMKLLMDRQVQEMRQEGYDLSWLTGLRQRYQYFGFEKAGVMAEFTLNKSNIKHTAWSVEQTPLRLEPLRSDDQERMGRARAFYDAQRIRCLRSAEAFYQYLLTGRGQPWVAINPAGEMVGYLTFNPMRNHIAELFAADEAVLASMVHTWFAQFDVQDAIVSLPSWQQDDARCLGRIAESVKMTDSGSWQMFNWPKVVGALLRVKCEQHQLLGGTLRIAIKDYGTLLISVSGDQTACDRTEERPDVEWDAFTATRMLFGNVPPASVASFPPAIEPLLTSWFPLPLSWPFQNYV